MQESLKMLGVAKLTIYMGYKNVAVSDSWAHTPYLHKGWKKPCDWIVLVDIITTKDVQNLPLMICAVHVDTLHKVHTVQY